MKLILDDDIPAFLVNDQLKQDFMTGLIHMLKGEDPGIDHGPLVLVFECMKPKRITQLAPPMPLYNPKGLTEAMLERMNWLRVGDIPSSGVGKGYADLEWKNILFLDLDYLKQLYLDCQDEIATIKKSTPHRRFLEYIVIILKHCAPYR